jgi:hypothetical protein
MLESLHAHLLIMSLADHHGAPLVHAASLRRGGRRILLVGPKGGGKTTLALWLLRDGYEVEGDENIFVTPDGLVARPRGMRVKESTATLVPGLNGVLKAAPCYQDTYGQRIYNLDPRSAGAASWRIEQGRAHAVILLHPNHGGHSSLRPISSLALVREVMTECGLVRTNRGIAVRDIVKFIGTAKGFDLSLGDPLEAVACINKALEGLN